MADGASIGAVPNVVGRDCGPAIQWHDQQIRRETPTGGRPGAAASLEDVRSMAA